MHPLGLHDNFRTFNEGCSFTNDQEQESFLIFTINEVAW